MMNQSDLFYFLAGVPVILCVVMAWGIFVVCFYRRKSLDEAFRLRFFVFCVSFLYLLLFALLACWCIYLLCPDWCKGWLVPWCGCLLLTGCVIFGINVLRQRGKCETLLLSGEESVLQTEKSREAMIEEQLISLFEQEQIYRKFDLRLEDVACRIGTNRTYVSAVINQKFGMNFLHYVNGYRIREAQYLMRTTDAQIKVIAEKVGFNSISVFNNCFKEYCHQSPSNWRGMNRFC